MHETILWEIGGMTLHGKTLIMTWIVMAIIIAFVLSGARHLTSGKPGKMQNVLEWMVDFVRKLISDNMDYEKGKPLLGYLVTLILFVFTSNVFGLVPNFTFGLLHNVEFAKLNEIFHGAALMSPTADINTTMALALMTMGLVFYMGIKHKGSHYFHHFLEPHPVFSLIHVIDLLSKPMTLAFRLFGNIYAGEVLISVILMLPGIWVLGGILPDTIWLAFSVFIGAIQSFVFTVLTTAYVAQAVAED
ncbi:ATP synthase F0, A subunit [Desulfitobacterium hafniense DP7]|uniref:ATP synthase subunit a n=1 Tax=Desulfitobacterium hafniense DP7 TaxID=537010 RepID=G9XTB7_DESHA|nr:F0F1 ATP synthase subunit A [Desulfitobacterium hafniense]EHL05083.1 ATP synthase F0, A subunit [Desulfitobacterium hafniense DP7]